MGTHTPGHIIYGYIHLVPMKQIVFKELSIALIYSPWYCEVSFSPAMRQKIFDLNVCGSFYFWESTHIGASTHKHTQAHTTRVIKKTRNKNKTNQQQQQNKPRRDKTKQKNLS